MYWEHFKFEYRADMLPLFKYLVDIEAYKEAALNLVLPPEWRDQLDRLNRVRAVYGTTALEGNPLSEAEVSHQMDLLSENKTQEKISREQLQIRNAGLAQAWVRQRFVPNSPPLSVPDILKIHSMVTQESDEQHNVPGRFRTFSVQVGSPDMGGVHIGAPAGALQRMMEEYAGFINSKRLEDEHPVVRALLAHFFLVTIHPFGDGNGRVSRLVEAGILFRQGYNVHGFYGLSNYFYKNEIRYKTLLQESRKESPFEMSPFVGFGVEGFALELKGINNFIQTKLNRVIYQNMLVRAFNKRVGRRRRLLNQREYGLLNFLLRETEPNDPFSDFPSRRIRFSALRESPYIQRAYGSFTPRTFYRELNRLGGLEFITIRGDETATPKDWNLELNFNAIGKY
jgi:Fic family protein